MPSKLSRQNAIVENIGEQLQTLYDEVLREPLPDRFCELLRRLESQKTTGETQSETNFKRAKSTARANPTRLETARRASAKRVRGFELA